MPQETLIIEEKSYQNDSNNQKCELYKIIIELLLQNGHVSMSTSANIMNFTKQEYGKKFIEKLLVTPNIKKSEIIKTLVFIVDSLNEKSSINTKDSKKREQKTETLIIQNKNKIKKKLKGLPEDILLKIIEILK